MKRKNGKNGFQVNALLVLLAIVVLITVIPANVMAKSLYVIADKGRLEDSTQPLQAYNIELDGTLTFQVEHRIPRRMLGAVQLAIDTDSTYLFITYNTSDVIQLVDARTMTSRGTTIAPDTYNLGGIVYDHDKKRLYTANLRWQNLYVYDWDSETATLTHIEGSPFPLKRANIHGIALNEIDDLLYVANGTEKVTVYRTSDWRLMETITLDRVATCVAVGVMRGFLYTGGGYAGNMYLTQYHLATGDVKEVQVEPDAGVMGIGVDPDTGYVYLTTGLNKGPGGDNLQVYDTKLNRIDFIPLTGNPTGLVVPGKDIGYNPLNLRKTLVRGGSGSANSGAIPSVAANTTITYGIHYDNFNDFIATDVVVTDQLPEEVIFISADDDGVNGQYDPTTHTYEWIYPSLPMGTAMTLELTVEVDKGVEAGTIVTNTATINTNQTAPTTTRLDVVVENNALNITKSISGTAEGEVARVDADESVTYTICFDNNNNDFPVTDVSVVDYLPDEVQFIGVGQGTPAGKYDATEHTYTWTFSSLDPGEAVCLDLDVKVDKAVEPGVTIINTAIIDSNETPPSSASAEAMTYQHQLNLTKRIVGAAPGEIPLVSDNETITYEIYFDNMAGDSPIHNVILMDVLPPEVSFVKAIDDSESGAYDAKTHTYTGFYGTLSPKTGTSLELVVQVNENAPPATTITNSVTLDCDETRPITASAEAMTKFKPLNIRKEIVGEDVIGSTTYAGPGDTVTYSICFDNDNDLPVTNVIVVDYLPAEVSFVAATGNKEHGSYDEMSHTFTWTYKSIPAESTTCERLEVRINKDVPRDKIIINTVKINSDQTDESQNPPDDNEINTGQEPSAIQEFSILPEIIRDTDGTYDIQVTAILPAGIAKEDLADEPPVLYLPEPYSGKIRATRQIIYSSSTRVKVIALFDKTELLNAVSEAALSKGISDRGPFTLTVVGKLKKGRSWYGRDIVYITGYTGR